jgi:sugar lactone lactonase YvrE
MFSPRISNTPKMVFQTLVSKANSDQPFFDVKVADKGTRKELKAIGEAEFIAFDERFFDIIGPKPKLEPMFDLGTSLREAPVYIPDLNILYIYDMGAQRQMRVDLNDDEPSLKYVKLNPHLKMVNGAAYSLRDGKIYACDHAGIYSIDPETLEVNPVLNNYVGHHFNSPNDLVVQDDSLWFTDPPYAQIMGNDSTAELRPNVYFYNLTSHVLRAVEEDLQLPNGLAFSPNGKLLYLADSGALCQPIGQPTVSDRHRSIYAYDIINGLLSNRRLVYITDFWVPDGIKVSRQGNIYAAAGVFVDVVSPEGELLGKIRCGGSMQNLQFAGKDLNELWIVGIGGVYRTKLRESGVPFDSQPQFTVQS